MSGVGSDDLSMRLDGVEIGLVVGGLLASSIGVLGTQRETGGSGSRDGHWHRCQDKWDDVGETHFVGLLASKRRNRYYYLRVVVMNECERKRTRKGEREGY